MTDNEAQRDVVTAARAPRSDASVAMYGLAIALTIANPLLHKLVSDGADALRARWGFARYDLVALIAIPLASLALSLPLIVRGRRFLRRPTALAALGALFAVSAAAQHWLLVVNIELIHWPQFALVAAVLLKAGVSGTTALLLATVSGMVDEAYQHLVIYRNTPGTYFDINDIVLNAIGAAWGVLLFASLSRRRSDGSSSPWGRPRQRALAAALGLPALALAWWWDPPVFTPFLRPTPAHPFYRVLSAPEGLIVCAVLAVIVDIAWRSRDGRLGGALRHARLASQSLLAVILMVTSGCATAAGDVSASPQAAVRPPATGFITTFWCGPPLADFDDRRAQEIAAAGFSVVGAPCEGAITPEGNRRALEIAARHGLSMWVADPRYNERARAQPQWEEALDAAVEDYRGFPAMAGYFVTDEPSPDQFADLEAIVARLRMRDPQHLAYINLNPDYVFGPAAETTYRPYVERFLEIVKPRLLSYDYYTFRVAGDRPTFFRSLALFREQSQRHQIPFLLIVLAMPHAAYRDPSEAELSWQAYHAVAYGAAGISYFAYWTPVDVPYQDVMRFRHGLIERGAPTRHYEEAARLNLRLRAIASELSGFRSVAVRDSNGEIAPALPFSPIANISGGPVTVGFFGDDEGRSMAMLVNRDYAHEHTIALRVDRQAGSGETFDADSRSWIGLRSQVYLPAGGAVLVRFARTRTAERLLPRLPLALPLPLAPAEG